MASQPLFGGYAAQVEPQRITTALPTATPEDYGAGIGDALSGAGQVAGEIAIRGAKLEAEREYDRQATAAMVDWAKAQEVYSLADNEARSAPSAPGAAGHAKLMSERAEKTAAEFLATISHAGLRGRYSGQVEEWLAGQVVSADAFERGQTAKLQATQGDTASDILANKAAGEPFEKYMQTLQGWLKAPSPIGVPQDAWGVIVREGAQKILISGLRGEEPERRRAVLDSHALDEWLTPEQVNALGNEADSDIRRKQIEAEAAARAAKAEDVEYVDDVLDRINRGYPVADEDYAEAMMRATRSGLEKRVRDLNDAHVGKQVNKEWANATPAQMDARIKVIDAELAKAGDKGNPALVAERAALDKLLTERRKQVASDPLAAGAAMGISVAPVDWSDPSSVAARRKAADATARAMGVPAKYLTDEEATQLAANIDTPDGRATVARMLRGFGPAAERAARQVEPDDPLFAYSMALRPEVQAAIYRGQALKGEQSIPAEEFREAWRDETGAAMQGMPAAFRETAFEATKMIYRNIATKRGLDSFDRVLFRGALREALGGVASGNAAARRGGVGEWNGAKIMLPPDMSQAQFDARLGGWKPSRAHRGDKTKIGGTELRDRFTPVRQPNGRYRFRSQRGEWAVVEDGRTALELDISKLTPATGAAARPQRVPESQRRPVYVAPPPPDVQGPRSAYEGL